MILEKLENMNKPYKIYAEVLEKKAIDQFVGTMELDTVVRGALMPDAHTGYTLPIGAVIACKDVIYPSFVGFDIGCGMCALPTTFDADHIKANTDEIFTEIYKRVPVGFAVNEKAVDSDLKREDLSEFGQIAFDNRKQLRGIGTLGGGK